MNVNNNGSRADVNTSTGHITFNDNDKLYVGYNNAYVGTLDYSTSDSKFIGNIPLTEAATAQKLHFYYLGGGAATQVGTTQQYTVDISDQTSNYPVISYGTSTQNYSASLNSYTTTLLNQCALVEFTTNEIPTTTAVSISGMKNKVTVDFNGNTLTPSEERGTITLHNTESAISRWAILLPDEEEVTSTASADGYNDSESFTVPAVNPNDYLAGESAVSISLTAPSRFISRKATCNTLAVPPRLTGSLPRTSGTILARQRTRTALTKTLTATSLAGARAATTTGQLPTSLGAQAKLIVITMHTVATHTTCTTRLVKPTGATTR